MMQVTPVRRKVTPSYPTRDYLDEHPELLLLVPERWRHNTLVLGVLSGILTLVFAGQSQAADRPSRIAPLFVHGDGRGTFGCVATNPPVFLSEDEAQQVIRDEAKKFGLDFAPGAFTIRQATVPVTQQYWCGPREGKEAKKEGTQSRDLVLDGYDRAHGVAYEFVSTKLIDAWQHDTCTSTVSSYDLRGTAERLRTGLAAKEPQTWVGLFYEPGAHAARVAGPRRGATDQERDAYWEGVEKSGREIGEKELRDQVRDFVKWLKAQGVI